MKVFIVKIQNQNLPAGGSVNSPLMFISQTKLLNFKQFSFLKNPSGADCWIHVEEPDNYVYHIFQLLYVIN